MTDIDVVFEWDFNPGDPIPEVDPEELKSVWTGAMRVSKEETNRNTDALMYRAKVIWIVWKMAPVKLAKFTKDGQLQNLQQLLDLQDCVFRTAAKIPLKFMAVGHETQIPPFDVDEFVQICGGNQTFRGQ